MKNLTTSSEHHIRLVGHPEINIAEIVMLEADVNYTKVYLSSGQSFLVAVTLKKFEERFLQQLSFFRTHKSYIVNLSYVADFTTEIKMKNQTKVMVARRRRPHLIERIRQVGFQNCIF